MLLIRPFLRMNQANLRPYHVVFFIFIVSNAGGMLTPVGDPPLFLGFLRGVPFWWNVKECYWAWILVMVALLAVFCVLERLNSAKQEEHPEKLSGPAVQIIGMHNFLFIAVIIVAIFQPGFADLIAAKRFGRVVICREMIMLVAASASKLSTGQLIYQRNSFSYGPIKEVAILFFGLFSTMVPALQWLGDNAARMAPRTPGQYYFTTGSLSAVLDNAPTYLAFFQLELGKVPREQVAGALADPHTNHNLIAIALGAVLFGAVTYIGNGPNFMVKSIADESGAPAPDFVGFMWRYSLPILGPIYLLVWWIFLR